MTDRSVTRAETFEAGLAVRKEVIGADYVERSLGQTSEFARPMQELVTEYCWGVAWTDDTLARRDRSLINLALLTALNRGHEFGVHVRGAIRNGLTVAEIRSVITQLAIYVGVPAALEATRIAEAKLAEMRDSGELAEFGQEL